MNNRTLAFLFIVIIIIAIAIALSGCGSSAEPYQTHVDKISEQIECDGRVFEGYRIVRCYDYEYNIVCYMSSTNFSCVPLPMK